MNVPNIYEYYRHFMLKWRRNILTSPQKQNNNIDTGRLIWLNGGKRNKKKYQHMSVLYVRKNTHTKQNQKKNENTIYTKRNVMSEMTNILMVGPKIYDECQKR